jgi:hypothetical protein
MTAFAEIIAISLASGVFVGLVCRFIVLVPITGLAMFWCATSSSGLNLAFDIAATTAALHFGYLAGAAMAVLIPAQIRRLFATGPDCIHSPNLTALNALHRSAAVAQRRAER